MIKLLQQQLEIKKYYGRFWKAFVCLQGSLYRFVEFDQMIQKAKKMLLLRSSGDQNLEKWLDFGSKIKYTSPKFKTKSLKL